MPYLKLAKLNKIDENENKNLKPIAIVKSEKGKQDPMHNSFLYLDLDDKQNPNKKTKIELEFHQKFEILPTTDPLKRNVFFIAGASGSGKSYITKMVVNLYAKLWPDRKIFVVSRLDEDETLDSIKSKNIIKLDIPSLVETPFDVNNPAFFQSCFIVDDCDALPDKNEDKAVQDLIDQISSMGRLHHKKKDEDGKETGQGGISLFFITHFLSNYKKSRLIMNEATHYVLYPQSTSSNQLYYVLNKYLGLERKEILNLKKMGSRWIVVHKNYPQYIIGQYSARILHQD